MLDKTTGKYIVKIVNLGDKPQQITLTFKGLKTLPAKENVQLTTLHSDNPMTCNTIEKKNAIVPVEQKGFDLSIDQNTATVTVPAKTFAVYKF